MNRYEAGKLIAIYAKIIPSIKKNNMTEIADAWAAIMPDIDYKSASVALIALSREYELLSLPPPALIIKKVNELKQINNTVAPADYIAWEEVRKKLTPYKKVKWSHPAIESTIRHVGTAEICSGDRNVMERFCRVYNQIISRQAGENNLKIAEKICNDISLHRSIAVKEKETKKIISRDVNYEPPY